MIKYIRWVTNPMSKVRGFNWEALLISELLDTEQQLMQYGHQCAINYMQRIGQIS